MTTKIAAALIGISGAAILYGILSPRPDPAASTGRASSVVSAAAERRGGPAKSVSSSWYEGASGYEEAERERARTGAPMALYFYTDWCGYCRKLESRILPEPDVVRYLDGVVKVKVDAEAGADEAALARRFGARGFPTFLIISGEGVARRVHPFLMRNGGPYTMTGAEFAEACREAEGG